MKDSIRLAIVSNRSKKNTCVGNKIIRIFVKLLSIKAEQQVMSYFW